MAEIKFKAGRRASSSCDSYRQIIKSGDIHADIAGNSDDVISFYPEVNTRIIIDCDKKTGEFRIVFTPKPLFS